MTPEKIKELIQELNPEAIFTDGWEKALIGMAKSCGTNIVAVYDMSKCIEMIIEEEEADPFDALDYFHACLDSSNPTINDPIFMNDFRQTVAPEDIINLKKLRSNSNLDDLIN